MQIQEKLHITYGRNRKKAAIGVYPLDRIAFPITYTAKYPHEIKFEALESSRIMAADEIIAEHRAGKEYGHLLTGLKKYPIFIDSKKQILSMPPIINSNTAGKVTEKTTEIFVECSGFDFQSLSICLNIIVTMFADMNADIYSVDVHYDPEIKITPDLDPKEMGWSLKYVNKRLGLKLNENEAVNIDRLALSNLIINDRFLSNSSSSALIASSENFEINGIFSPAFETGKTIAGDAVIPSQSQEIIIYNSKITDTSLVYLTPTTEIPT